jgi:hypothetical protein
LAAFTEVVGLEVESRLEHKSVKALRNAKYARHKLTSVNPYLCVTSRVNRNNHKCQHLPIRQIVHGVDSIKGIGARSVTVIALRGIKCYVIDVMEGEIGIRLGRYIFWGSFECHNIVSTAEKRVRKSH